MAKAKPPKAATTRAQNMLTQSKKVATFVGLATPPKPVMKKRK